MKKAVLALVGAVLSVTIFAPAVLAQTDPAALVRRAADAINRRDVAGALALLADDIVQEAPPGCPPCVGKAANQTDIERRVAINQRLAIADLRVSGSTVTARLEVRQDTLVPVGVERVVSVVRFETREDRIAVIRLVGFDPMDAQTARFLAFLESQQPPIRPPRLPVGFTLPRTGSGAVPPLMVGSALAAALTVLGLVARGPARLGVGRPRDARAARATR